MGWDACPSSALLQPPATAQTVTPSHHEAEQGCGTIWGYQKSGEGVVTGPSGCGDHAGLCCAHRVLVTLCLLAPWPWWGDDAGGPQISVPVGDTWRGFGVKSLGRGAMKA